MSAALAVITTAGKSRRRPAPPDVAAADQRGGLGRPGRRSGVSASLAISLDAMGGDNAPEMVVRGADIARRRFPQCRFLFFGDEAQIRPLLDTLPELKKVSTIRHTVSVVTMDDKPGQALRSGRGSSMRLAIDAVHNGEADAVVSAGNTGALMAMAKFVLKTMPGIDRPAI